MHNYVGRPDFLVSGKPAYILGDRLVDVLDNEIGKRSRVIKAEKKDGKDVDAVYVGPWTDMKGTQEVVRPLYQSGATALGVRENGDYLDFHQAISDAEAECDFVLVVTDKQCRSNGPFDGRPHLEKYKAR